MGRIEELAAAYDALASTYAAGRHRFDTRPVLESCAKLLPRRARILDAGCGAGEPVARYFVNRGDDVIGIDLSEGMLDLARQKVPEARYERMDLSDLGFPPEAFDLVASVYCLFHLDRSEHQKIFSGFARVLAPGGVLLATLATREYTGSEEFDGEIEFLGQRLPYSHDRPATALAKLRAARLEPLEAELIETGGETFFWVIARKEAVIVDHPPGGVIEDHR